MLRVSITSTFSFQKLANKLNDIIGDYGEDFNKALARDAFNFIKSGKVRPTLLESTKNQRKSLGFKKTPALDRTSLLADTLEGTRDGILMQPYGKYHLEGDGVRERNFLFTPSGKFKGATRKGDAKRIEKFIKEMNKAMKVSGSGRTGSLSSFLKG